MINRYCRINTFYNNSVDAYTPAMWANESLMILHENMVAAQLIDRQFENLIQDHGDTVNTRRPSKFLGIRKDVNDDVTDQDAVATNVAIVLNQLLHVSFVIRDAQASKAFKDLVTEFLQPAMLAEAKFVDQAIIGQYPQFLANQVGQVNGLTTSNVRTTMLAARQIMNVNLAPEDQRALLWSPVSETTALNTDLFTSAYAVGDDGTALANATLGKKLGFMNYMSQNVGYVPTNATNQLAGTGSVNLSAGYAIGATAITITGLTAAIPAGSFILIDGRIYRVVSSVGGSSPTSVTIAAPGLVAAVANTASVVGFTSTTVNFSAGYALGYGGVIVYTSVTNNPVAGQMVTFGTSSTAAMYTILQVDTVGLTITLDRPLDAAVANAAAVNFGPYGNFNLAFRPNAIALISRPLALPPNGVGAKAAVVNFNNVSMRATIAYDSKKQGTRVTLDMLYGIKVLDASLGALMLG